MVQRYFLGLGFFNSGWRLLKAHKSLWNFIWIPLVINIACFGAGLIYGAPMIPALIAKALVYVFPSPEGFWYSLTYYPLVLVFGVVFLISLSAFVYLLSSLISSPFNALLAERTLMKIGIIQAEPFNLVKTLKVSIKMFVTSLLRLAVLLFASVLLFIISFIPGLNIISSFLTFVILAFDASDYALEALQLSLSQRLAFLRSNFAEYSGMASFFVILMFIPGVIVVLMPIVVVGAAQLTGHAHTQRNKIDSRQNP